MLKRIGLAVVGVGLFFGFKFWNKNSEKSDMRKLLVQKCEADQACVSAVNQHFEVCFDEAYSMGGRRRGSSLDTDKFLGCFNTKAGAQVFSAKASE